MYTLCIMSVSCYSASASCDCHSNPHMLDLCDERVIVYVCLSQNGSGVQQCSLYHATSARFVTTNDRENLVLNRCPSNLLHLSCTHQTFSTLLLRMSSWMKESTLAYFKKENLL